MIRILLDNKLTGFGLDNLLFNVCSSLIRDGLTPLVITDNKVYKISEEDMFIFFDISRELIGIVVEPDHFKSSQLGFSYEAQAQMIVESVFMIIFYNDEIVIQTNIDGIFKMERFAINKIKIASEYNDKNFW